MIETKVISLQRTPERLETFAQQNSHLTYSVFSAIEGAEVSETSRLRFIDPNYIYRPGALGNAMSHQILWNEIVTQNKPMTICEDDAIFHKDFALLSQRIIETLPEDWDVCLWGFNLDSLLYCFMPEKLSTCCMRFNQDDVRNNYPDYIKSDIQSAPFQLIQALGTICYSMSPKGAKIFLSQTQPIRRMNVFFPCLARDLENVALDISMNAFYGINKSYVAFPPLVITKNEIESSTVQSRTSKKVGLYI